MSEAVHYCNSLLLEQVCQVSLQLLQQVEDDQSPIGTFVFDEIPQFGDGSLSKGRLVPEQMKDSEKAIFWAEDPLRILIA